MSISLMSVSNINHELTEFSINKSCEAKKFDEVLVFSDRVLPNLKYQHTYHDIATSIAPYDTTTMKPVPLTLDIYCDFLFKHMGPYINTEHVISIQYDGFCVNQDEWTDEFLDYDYIGSPTHKKWYPLANSLIQHEVYDSSPNGWYNGGGGCSLRSKKLITALQDPEISVFISDKNYQRCEDWSISVRYREYLEKAHGIKFAPLDLSLKFSTELLTGLNFSFGFHGWENIPLFFTEEECIWYIENLQKENLKRGHYMTRRFAAMCWIQNYHQALAHLDHVLNEIDQNIRNNNYSR